nr:RNA-directed DNA polymerase, eukaryota, reverse transcriptase zinc-binding domain protein [Tanacetum cinerariifolium]
MQKELGMAYKWLYEIKGTGNPTVKSQGDRCTVPVNSNAKEIFHYWLEIEGFSKMVKDGWRDSPCDRSNALRNLTGKLKHLKNDIRVWNKTKGNSNRDAKDQLKLELEVVHLCIGNGNGTVEDIKRRGEIVNKLQDIDKLHALEMMQKAKMTFSNQISIDQKWDREGEVTNDEIKKAVWDCGTDKAPGPDGFTFGFYRKFCYAFMPRWGNDPGWLRVAPDILIVTDQQGSLGCFLATNDATSPILKTFITGLENQLSLSVKVIRSDNGTEFMNIDLNQFCGMKGIKREFSVTRIPQQMALLKEKTGKFEGTVDERFFVGYSVVVLHGCLILIVSHRLQIVNQSLQEIDQQYLLFPMWSSGFTNPQNNDGDAAFDGKEPDFDAKKPESEVIVSLSSSPQSKKQDDKTKKKAKGKSLVESFTGYRDLSAEFKDYSDNSINEVNVAGTLVPTVGQISPNSTNTFSVAGNTFSAAGNTFSAAGPSNVAASPTHGKYSFTPNPTTRVHKDHPVTQIIGDLSLATQTRSMARVAKDLGGLSQMFNDDFHTCMFACVLSQEEPKRVHQALKDPSWIEAMQEELLQFKMQKVWILVDFPYRKRAIGTKWVFGNKKDERCIVVRNKARLIAQGHIQEEDLCKSFEKLMKDKFQISSMGELTFFLDLQVKQKKDGKFISQNKYVAEILRKFGLTDTKSASTPINTKKPFAEGS